MTKKSLQINVESLNYYHVIKIKNNGDTPKSISNVVKRKVYVCDR